MPKIKFTIITLFEDALRPYLETSMMWKAVKKGIAEFDFVNLRDFGLGPHKSVDDTPYGGGDGMLLRCEPVFAAIESVKEKDPSAKVILPTPAGVLWTQDLARRLSKGDISDATRSIEDTADGGLCDQRGAQVGGAPVTNQGSEETRACSASMSDADSGPKGQTGRAAGTPAARVSTLHYVILCPHYEGYDERILSIVDYKISLGHYVLTGGELPALIIIDSIVRLLPGVLGGETSAEIESFSDGDNIEFPQYTKPAEFRGMKVPEVLLSGHHGKVDEWRKSHERHAD